MNFFYNPRPFLAEHKQHAIKTLIEDTIPDRDFYLLIVGAVLLALSGIFLDSIPVLIAGMIVAPLMYPLLLLSLGLTVCDGRLVMRSIAMLFVSVCIAIVITVPVSLVAMNVFSVSPEKAMISFSPNYFFDIFIALISGFIATYGLVRSKVGGAMMGIGIAVSLMPPLVATGIELAALNNILAMDAFTIFALNVGGILVASYLTFVCFGFYREYQNNTKGK
ncbi:MAG: DUF389 domain-containing protein [Parcubacteria group bacterium]|nr:DUF389 domain-containing protein [Parcubacteria group bacterium]